MTGSPAIETHDLRKVFGEKTAVNGLTLRVERGEVFGFLGPNGAEKTTSIKMLLGLTAPTSGNAFLLGEPLGVRSALVRVGFLPEHFRFQEWLTAAEFLELHGQLYGMGGPDLKSRIGGLLERVGLAGFRNAQLHTFSKGMLQRIGLAQALLNRPLLVCLDEPTSGLDPVGRRLVRDIIHELRRDGTSVFLNSHLLSEIEVTCDRVAFLRHGEVVRLLELSEMTAGQTSVTIRARGFSAAVLVELGQWSSQPLVEGETITLGRVSEAALPEITRCLVAHGVDVYSITPKHVSLEEIFVETVGQDGGL